MAKTRIIVAVSNDLATDQRMKRHCSTLHSEGYDILLTGRLLSDSLSMDDRPYKTVRIRHFFNKGPLFYSELNVRLFFYLLFNRFDILNANDLDTLPACFLVSLIRRKHLVYDSHEYFTEVPELAVRPLVKRIWKSIERAIFPRLRHIITVNHSIASAYMSQYGKEIHVIRNLPFISVNQTVLPGAGETATEAVLPGAGETATEAGCPATGFQPGDYGIPSGRKLIILQGSGINADRGAEEAVNAMRYINGAVLMIAGGGNAVPFLREKVAGEGLKEKVLFLPLMPYEKLMALTAGCDVGLSLDRDTALNHRYSLPNKLFDYIMAGIPVVASPLPEVTSIVEGYGTGLIISNHEPQEIASKINLILETMPKESWSDRLCKAAAELNWENEKEKLTAIYRNILEPQQ